MSENNGGFSCLISCCIMGFLAGVMFGGVFYVIADYEFTQAVFAGVVIAAVVAVIMGLLTCGKSNSQDVAGDCSAVFFCLRSGARKARRNQAKPAACRSSRVGCAQG